MNKERYLFRGKRLDNGELVEGYYVCLNGKEHRIYTGYAETDCGDYYPDWYTVDPSTVGKYTGLKDENGTWIFEGDILEFTNSDGEKSYYSVVWHDVGWCIRYDEICTEEMTDWHSEEWEIVGNIHDNPELLEG